MLSDKILESIPPSIRIIRRFSTEAVGGALTLQQLRTLNLIREGQGPSLMAETLGVSLAAVSKMITCLSNKKLIIRKAGDDRRTSVITLTTKGTQVLDKVSDYVKAKMNKHIVELSKEEKEELMRGLMVLDKLVKHLKEV
jgi:DNA-binding MarR family transcriptional regulator